MCESTNYMNKKLEELSNKNKFYFLDSSEIFFNNNELLKKEYRSNSHHYNKYTDFDLCIKKKHFLLEQLLFGDKSD
jgi:hypothetical protein